MVSKCLFLITIGRFSIICPTSSEIGSNIKSLVSENRHRPTRFETVHESRSPVAHLNGVQGVAGSNPAVPIEVSTTAHKQLHAWGLFAFPAPPRSINTCINTLGCRRQALRAARCTGGACTKPFPGTCPLFGKSERRPFAASAKLEGLEEANALSDRFGIAMPKLEYPNEPRAIELPETWRLAVGRPQTEESADGTARSRRTYAEIKATPTYDIIQQAGGPKPFRPLTEAEQKAFARAQAHRARGDVDPYVKAEAETIAGIPSSIPANGAGIYRG
jgi:hypothetical protein